MVPRLVSQHKRNQSQVSLAWLQKLALYQYLLQSVCLPCSSYGVQRDGNHCTQHWEITRAGRQPTSHSAATTYRLVGGMGPSDFHLVGPLTQHLAGKRFEPDTDKKQAVISWLQTLHTDVLYAWIKNLLPPWNKR